MATLARTTSEFVRHANFGSVDISETHTVDDYLILVAASHILQSGDTFTLQRRIQAAVGDEVDLLSKTSPNGSDPVMEYLVPGDELVIGLSGGALARKGYELLLVPWQTFYTVGS